MRILHIINCLGRGGAERLLVDSLPLYKESSLSVLELSSLHSEPEYVQELESTGIVCMTLGKEAIRSPKILGQLIRFLRHKAHQFDIIHVHLFPALYFTALASKILGLRKLVPLVYTEHSTQNQRTSKSYLKPLEKWIYGNYDVVVAISPAIAARLKQGVVDPARVQIIRNGVSVTRFSQARAYSPDYFENEFKLSTGDQKIIMTARFNYPKNQQLLVKALKHLSATIHVFFIGEGEGLEKVRQFTNLERLENRVHFLGFRSDVPEIMKSADINILASRYEGMSGVTLEALASGRPFLGSNVPGIKDVVPDERFLFPAEDARELANKIQHIISDKAFQEQMIQDGQAFIMQFDLKKMISDHSRLYKKLASTK